jgi:PAS domain S-box-containing protein
MMALSEHVGIAIARARLYTEVRESERKVRAIIEAMPDLMVRVNRNGQILSFGANPQRSRELYMSHETIVGSTINAILPPAIAELVQNYIHKALQAGELQVFEYEQSTSQGSQVYEVRLVVSGEQEVLAIVRDVSERARLEQMKSDFINRAAHELRTPLTTASMMVDLLQDGGSQEEQQQYLGILDAELQRQRTLVEELLTVGRLESGTFQLVTHPLDLASVVQTSLSAVISLAHVKQIDIDDSIEAELPMVAGSETGLQQVFINLLSNAIKFTPPEGKVMVAMDTYDGGVRTRVSDTGMGIPREDLPHLFSRFFRASNAIHNEVPGTGVGLYVVKSIVEKLGGRMAVESVMGKGTTFEVWLPEAKEDEVMEADALLASEVSNAADF